MTLVYNLYSSAKIQKLGDKSPLEVKIETPENITKVTQDMYRNAAVTLGVEHAKITVAAPIPVTGECFSRDLLFARS